MDARLDHGAVDLGQQVGRGLVGTGDDLFDGLQGVDLVTGIDALRRVAHGEIRAVGQAGFLLQDGHADLFGEAGVDRGFIDHHAALGHVAAHGVAGAHHGGEVGGAVFVDGGGHGHDDHGGPGQVGRVAGVLDRGGQGLVGHFVGAVMAFAQLFDASGVDVETEHVHVAGKSHGQGQAHIAQAHHGQGLFTILQGSEIHHRFILYKNACFRHVKDMTFDWKPFLVALGLAILLEGLVWALAPDAMRRAVILIAQMPKSSIRVLGLAALALGLFLVWLARSA